MAESTPAPEPALTEKRIIEGQKIVRPPDPPRNSTPPPPPKPQNTKK